MGVVCQFSPADGRPTLKDYIREPAVYPAGRLDSDSEGLLLLTDSGALQHRISDPRHKWSKTYLVQVEGAPDEAAMALLRRGIVLNDGPTLPAEVACIAVPAGLWERVPPIRVRREIPTHWLRLVLREGRNRQVRRMTAAVGLPTLRLIRWAIGPYDLDRLAPGQYDAVQIFP